MNQNEFCTRETAWCPGCGNFSILTCLKKTLEKMELEPHKVLMVAGIGQAANPNTSASMLFAASTAGLCRRRGGKWLMRS
jgi:Pyruvate:ferredoxin oxidoreductase and related 2-oxoacid:ferredoxin oxidoreductases, beta subunit